MTNPARIIPFLVLIFSTCCAFAQSANNGEEQVNVDAKRNEIKLNLGYLIWGYVELSYERMQPTSNSSVGCAIGGALTENIDIHFSVLPYYRFFFGGKKGAGFFIEGNGVFFIEDTYQEDVQAIGLGVAMGGKFFRTKGWHGEFVLGLGRIVNNYNDDFGRGYPRFAISVGRRF